MDSNLRWEYRGLGKQQKNDVPGPGTEQEGPPISVLGLSVRPYSALRRAEIDAVGQLAAFSDEKLLAVRNLGKTSVAEIREKLDAYLSKHPEIRIQTTAAKPDSPAKSEQSLTRRATPGLGPSIEVLQLSTRAYNALHQAGIDTIVQLAAKSNKDLLGIGSLGNVSLREIRSKLNDYLDMHPELGQPSSTDQPRRMLPPGQSATTRPTVVPDGTPSIKVLDLSVRTHNCLSRAGMATVGQLAVLSDDELLEIHNLGPGSLAEIGGRLKDYLDAHPECRAQVTAERSKARTQQGVQPAPSPRIRAVSPSIDVLQLSPRARNSLRKAGVHTVTEALALSDEELLGIRALGLKTSAEIRQKLDEYLEQHPEHRILPQSAGAEGARSHQFRYRPPLVDAGLLGLTSRIPLIEISVQRLLLPRKETNRLRRQQVSSVGELARQPADAFSSDSCVPRHLKQYLNWLVTQEESIWNDEVVGERVSPMHRLLLSDTTLDQLVAEWLKSIRKRPQEVLRLRLGYEGAPLTLEEVGQRIGRVTRERARQIEGQALTRLKNSRALQPIGSLALLLEQEFMSAGGLMAEDEVCERLTDLVRVEEVEPAWAARLLLHTSEEFEGPKGELWALAGRPLELVPDVEKKLVELLGDAGRPVTVQELLTRFAATAFGRGREGQLDDAFLRAILRVSQESELAEDMVQQAARPAKAEQRTAGPVAPPTTLAAWERHLRPQVAQVELLGEIRITAEECAKLGKAIGLRLKKMRTAEVTRVFRKNYPCSLAVFLVAQGVHGYGGTKGYWPGVEEVIDKKVGANLHGQLGRLFETILSDMGLPLFPDLGGRRYVDLILVHGGIPDYSLPDFFGNLLQPGVTRPQYAGMSAVELIDEWLWRASGRYFTDKPVLRFLEFGGGVAEDFVERCLEMARETVQSSTHRVPQAEELGLPKRVVDGYRLWVGQQDITKISAPDSSWRLRKPELLVDPWGEGVLLDLPPQQVPATEIQAGIVWQVETGAETHTLPVHVRRTGFDWRTSAETLPLSHQAASYEVELLADGEGKRTWHYQGVDEERPLLVYDPDRGNVLTWKHSLPARRLGLLFPREYDLRIDGQGELLEELPRMPWGWSDFKGQVWDLSHAHRLVLRRKGETALQVSLRPDESVQRPHLEGGHLLSAGEPGRRAPVYGGSPPVVRVPLIGRQALDEELTRWRVAVRNKWAADPEVELLVTLSDPRSLLTIGDGYVDLPLHSPSLLGSQPSGSFSVRLRGPLGRDAEFTLRIVPHLEISGHEELYLPDAQGGPQAAMLSVETLPGYSIECQGEADGCQLVVMERHEDRWVTQIKAEPEVTLVDMTVVSELPSGEAVRVPTAVPIRRLRWALVEEQTGTGRRRWTGRAVRRPVDALLQVASPCLLVELPRMDMDDVGLRIRLRDVDGSELQQTDWLTLPQGQRLWRFELGAFLDTIHAFSQSPFLRFELEAYGLPGDEKPRGWPVLILTRTLLVENVQLQVHRRGRKASFELRWQEESPMTNRHVYFWPLWRPWDPVFEQAIPDNARGTFAFDAPTSQMRSGKYRLEFLVQDPWVSRIPQRPQKNVPGVVDVELISPKRKLYYLNSRLEKVGPSFETLLERALVLLDAGELESAQEDCQWCYRNLDDGTIPQILTLVEIINASDDANTKRALKMKMFAASRFERFLKAQREGSISREQSQTYLANQPRWGLLPQDTIRQLLSFDDEVVRLHAVQELVRRDKKLGVEAVLKWIEEARLSDADGVSILALNSSLAVEYLRQHSGRPAAQRLLGALSHTVEDVVRVGNWLRCNLGWGRVERIEHLNTGDQVKWCTGGESHYRLTVVLRPDVQPEMITIDLASSTADFCERGAVRTCTKCWHFSTRDEDLMSEHYRNAHPARGYWDRRYRRDEFAKFKFEDRPIALSLLELASEKPAKQLV